jgi:hypothetical protein
MVKFETLVLMSKSHAFAAFTSYFVKLQVVLCLEAIVFSVLFIIVDYIFIFGIFVDLLLLVETASLIQVKFAINFWCFSLGQTFSSTFLGICQLGTSHIKLDSDQMSLATQCDES